MRCFRNILLLALLVGLGAQARAEGTNVLVWKAATDHVTADIHREALWPLLENIAHQTGWHIFVEPGIDRVIDVKFRNLSGGDALKKLLGDLNFALVSETNGPDLLYVFTTTMQAATRPVSVVSADKRPRHVANQLLVKLKPGANIDAIAKAVGAKVISRDDKDHMYLLEFADAAATDTALGQLQNNSDVASVAYNTLYYPPAVPQAVANAPAAPPALTLDVSQANDPCSPVIALIDTAYQSSGTAVDQFVKPQISVAGNVTPSATGLNHGTAMAQAMLVGQEKVLQANNISKSSILIQPIDAFGNSDSATSWSIIQALMAAATNGVSAVNMSLGSSEDNSVEDDYVEQLIEAGIPVFAAAGNTPGTADTYPAADPGVNAVTALSGPGQLASYADDGSFVDMALPGTSYAYLNGQAYMVQGTSPATAYATGIATANKMINCGSWSSIITGMDKQFPVPAAPQQ